MEIEILHDKKNEIEFIIKDETHTFPQLLVTELIKDKDVDIAQYKIEHPLVGRPTVYVKTKSKSPKDALKKALKTIKKEVAEIK
ncbi:MAG: DNA-directed RNA polymerase subunit L [DPANN group archaeon]|nr:DNA-directed RNA polymerase subunit L [DPANN group archaeon]